MLSEQFLDLYRELEDELENKYSGKKRRYSSVIFEFLNDSESKPIKDKLDVCREIRNMLTHTAKINGQNVIEPSEGIIQSINDCLEYIRRPSLALDVATKGENILKAGYQQTVIKIMGIMDRNGFSHMPIIQNGEFIGVFSLGTVFSYILNNYEKPITKSTTIESLREQLPISAHIEKYEFAPKTLTCAEARKKFEYVKGKNKRLSVIFITETGQEKERLLGMLTPWDVLGEK